MSMANIRRRVNFYRSLLDPRYPDYEEPMDPEDEDDEPPFDDCETWGGPYRYPSLENDSGSK